MTAIRMPKLNLMGIQVSKQVSQKLGRTPKIPQMLLVRKPYNSPSLSNSHNPHKPHNTHKPHKPHKPHEHGWTKTTLPRFLIRYQTVIIVICLMVVVFLVLANMQDGKMLRRIQKVDCVSTRGVFTCSSKYSTGTMMISMTKTCKEYIYEVGGVPFVRIPGFGGTMVVKAAHTVQVRDARPSCKMTMHRTAKQFVPAKHSGIVWVTTKKHTQFTMVVNGVEVLEQTPVGLIDSEINGNWVAYMFDPEVITTVENIEITGDSTDAIHVYI